MLYIQFLIKPRHCVRITDTLRRSGVLKIGEKAKYKFENPTGLVDIQLDDGLYAYSVDVVLDDGSKLSMPNDDSELLLLKKKARFKNNKPFSFNRYPYDDEEDDAVQTEIDTLFIRR